MSELVVLTCASGKQCSQLIPLLYEEPSLGMLRLVVHSRQSLEILQQKYPKAEVLQANLSHPEDCSKILKGATTMYYVSPTFEPHETQFGLNVIEAAVAESARAGSKFSHFIFSSVIHPEINKLLNHSRKRDIEEFLCESSLPYTILQPSHFADNAIGRLIEQRNSPQPVFMAAHNPDVSFSFSCLRDHAEVSFKVIRERSKHFYATYQLVSTWPMKYTEYVKSIGDEIGKSIEIKQVSYEQIVDNFCQMVFGSDRAGEHALRDGPERLLLYYNKRGLVGNPRVLEWLLGRPGTTPAQLARILIDAASGAKTT